MFPRCRLHHVTRSYLQTFDPGRMCIEDRSMAHLVPGNSIKVAEGAHDSLPLIRKRVLQESLYRNAITHTELRRERVASPGARPVQRQQGPTSATTGGPAATAKIKTHTIVAAASFQYPHGHRPHSASKCPPPHAPQPCYVAHTGQSLHAQASMLARRRSATRRLGAMRQSG